MVPTGEKVIANRRGCAKGGGSERMVGTTTTRGVVDVDTRTVLSEYSLRHVQRGSNLVLVRHVGRGELERAATAVRADDVVMQRCC